MRYLLLLSAGFIWILSCESEPANRDVAATAARSDTVQKQHREPRVDSYGFRIDTLQISDHQVKRNESLYQIFASHDIPEQKIYSITQQARDLIDFRDLRPGQSYRMYTDRENRVGPIRFVWEPNPLKYVVFDLQDSIRIYEEEKKVEVRREHASGTIRSSLYETLVEKGNSPMLVFRLSEILAWQIDFFNLREGDRFKLIYEKQYIDGTFFDLGRVLAVEFTHRETTYKAFRYEMDGRTGFYDEKGRSVQKALLKAPFKYSQRISSGYSHSRFHPVLKRRVPHYGVDYAAPYGTPVLSVGDGTVIEARYRGANGNIVKIRHNNTYETAYLHLKGFARGIRRGAGVRQGQVIGYVGRTGRVTGTHLDYRVYKNDRPVNPLKLELPPEKSIPGNDIAKFNIERQRLQNRLDEIILSGDTDGLAHQ